jgi:hypothetical protein
MNYGLSKEARGRFPAAPGFPRRSPDVTPPRSPPGSRPYAGRMPMTGPPEIELPIVLLGLRIRRPREAPRPRASANVRPGRATPC